MHFLPWVLQTQHQAKQSNYLDASFWLFHMWNDKGIWTADGEGL